MFSVFDFNLQHHQIFQVWAFRLSGNQVNFKFYRLNQQGKNHTLTTWITRTNDWRPYRRIQWFVMWFKTGFVLPSSGNRNTKILCVFCLNKRIALLITDYKISVSFVFQNLICCRSEWSRKSIFSFVHITFQAIIWPDMCSSAYRPHPA